MKFFNFLQIWYSLCSILQFSTDMTSNKSTEEVQLKTNRSSKAHYQNRTIQTLYHSTTLQQILKAFTNLINMKTKKIAYMYKNKERIKLNGQFFNFFATISHQIKQSKKYNPHYKNFASNPPLLTISKSI